MKIPSSQLKTYAIISIWNDATIFIGGKDAKLQ